MTRLPSIAVLLLASSACLADQNRGDTPLVVRGEPKLVAFEGVVWKRQDAYLEGGGEGNVAAAGKVVGAGEARIHARLSIHGLTGSAASFVISDNHFGFEGRSRQMFVEGPDFGGGARPIGEPVVKDGVPFDFEIVRAGNTLTFRIDGVLAHTQTFTKPALGAVGFRPHRATMRIYSWSVAGELKPLPRERRLEFLVDVFSSGAEGAHTHRIPAIVTTSKGTLLAFCEARRIGRGDAGDIDLIVKRSTDAGETWSELLTIWDDGGNTCGNPCPVVDRSTGRIWLPMTWNLGSDHEREIMAGTSKFPRRAFITYSDDDGQTWARPYEISSSVRREHWRWYATGPGNAIQLTRGPHRGRLVVPANHSDHTGDEHPYRSHVFYSDDHGATWKLGGVLGARTNESTIVELEDGRILDNMRSYHGKNRRAVATSADGGDTWSPVELHTTLIEPVCQGNILRFDFSGDRRPSRILFCNPASTGRERLTVRLSEDEGLTWPISAMVYRGSAAYSCMTVLADGRIGILFEREGYSKISFTRFTMEWLRGE